MLLVLKFVKSMLIIVLHPLNISLAFVVMLSLKLKVILHISDSQ